MEETIVLIDDDKATQFIHKRAIAKHNKYKNVLTFSGGRPALEYFKNINIKDYKKPQLILLDLNMPVMNGWEFIEKYENLNDDLIQHSKVFILTTSTNPRDIERSKKTGRVTGFINKHLTVKILDEIFKKSFPSVS